MAKNSLLKENVKIEMRQSGKGKIGQWPIEKFCQAYKEGWGRVMMKQCNLRNIFIKENKVHLLCHLRNNMSFSVRKRKILCYLYRILLTLK